MESIRDFAHGGIASVGAAIILAAWLRSRGERDGWRCWLCDEPVDPQMSVNDPRGPSVDSIITKAKAKSKGAADERLAHRGCNTRKGAVAPVVPWPSHLFVVDPAPIFETADALQRKGGRAVVARCPTKGDGEEAEQCEHAR